MILVAVIVLVVVVVVVAARSQVTGSKDHWSESYGNTLLVVDASFLIR